jgi:hypothetical protein
MGNGLMIYGPVVKENGEYWLSHRECINHDYEITSALKMPTWFGALFDNHWVVCTTDEQGDTVLKHAESVVINNVSIHDGNIGNFPPEVKDPHAMIRLSVYGPVVKVGNAYYIRQLENVDGDVTDSITLIPPDEVERLGIRDNYDGKWVLMSLGDDGQSRFQLATSVEVNGMNIHGN